MSILLRVGRHEISVDCSCVHGSGAYGAHQMLFGSMFSEVGGPLQVWTVLLVVLERKTVVYVWLGGVAIKRM